MMPRFEPGEEVTHPHDPGWYGRVVSQDRGSVIVRWWNGDVDSIGALALDECRIGEK